MVGGDNVGVHYGGGERRLGHHSAVRRLAAATLVKEDRLQGRGVKGKLVIMRTQ